MSAYTNPVNPLIITAEDFAKKHGCEINYHAKTKHVPKTGFKLKSASGMTCQQVLEESVSGMGVALLFSILKRTSKIPSEFKGKRIFCTRESFVSEKRGHFILFLDCTGVEPDYADCRIDHEHPFNRDDFFVEYE